MHSQFLPLLRNEITKAARRRLPYFSFFCIGLLCAAIYLAAGRLNGGTAENGWGYLAFSMQIVFTDLGPIFIINFAALLLAQETGTGTIRSALAAPVHRWELFAAKAAMGLLYTLALSMVALIFPTALAKMNYDFSRGWRLFRRRFQPPGSLARISAGLRDELDSIGSAGGVWLAHLRDYSRSRNGCVGGHGDPVDHRFHKEPCRARALYFHERHHVPVGRAPATRARHRLWMEAGSLEYDHPVRRIRRGGLWHGADHLCPGGS